MSGKRTLSQEEAQGKGMAPILDEQMENGELRFRRMHKGGFGYILTVAGVAGAWQNSHLHHGVRELYAVQRGWMAYAELVKTAMATTMRIRICNEGAHFATEPGTVHNVYMPTGAIIHTVKFGKTEGGPDWHASPELDALTKLLAEDDIRRLAEPS